MIARARIALRGAGCAIFSYRPITREREEGGRGGGYTDFFGHRFLLKSSTRDCATGRAIQFCCGPNQAGNGRARRGRRPEESRSLSSNQGRPPTPASRLYLPLLLPNSGFPKVFVRERIRAATRIYTGNCRFLPRFAAQPPRGNDSGLSDSLGVSVRWNPDAEERAEERCAAAVLARHSSRVAKLRVFCAAFICVACSRFLVWAAARTRKLEHIATILCHSLFDVCTCCSRVSLDDIPKIHIYTLKFR